MSNSQEQNTDKVSTEAVNQITLAESEPMAEAIEEDDEFEEFEPCRWNAKDEDADDAQQWQVCDTRFILSLYIHLHHHIFLIVMNVQLLRITGMTMILKTILHSSSEQNSCKILVIKIWTNNEPK
jgi:hypothetical protein